MDSSAFKASLLKNSLPGTKPWLNGVRLVSTGLAQLDQFLGGGLPLGSLVLIEEDQNAVHAQTLMQYFVSQGIACGHRVCIAGGDGLQGFQEFVNTLPANVSTSGRSSSQTENSQQKMESTQDPSSELKIAWQYKKYMGSDADNPALHAMPQVGEGTQKQRKQEKMKYCCAFDLHRRLPREEWEASDSRTFNVSKVMLEGEYSSVRETQGTYSSACRFLADQVRLSTNEEANNPKAGRLCVLGAGGPQWGGLSGGTDSGGDKQFVRFLHSLKRIVSSKPPQSHHSLAIVTIPSNTLPTHVLSRARCIADGVIQITAFAERGPEAARSKSLGNSDSSLLLRTHKQTSAEEFADYTGMLTIKKIPCINSLVSARPDTLTYLFKRDRRKMKIERFHLPPESTRATGATSTNPEDTQKSHHKEPSTSGPIDKSEPPVSLNMNMQGGMDFLGPGLERFEGTNPSGGTSNLGVVGLRRMDPRGSGSPPPPAPQQQSALEPGMACGASLHPDPRKNLYDF